MYKKTAIQLLKQYRVYQKMTMTMTNCGLIQCKDEQCKVDNESVE